ncbi:hypothetical protein LMG26845_05391 [Achromobacter insuavis]|uniref:Uncharacterized protein n=1 Tax=Achromobacter insuavis TaxID=1287735 RepID=A0A6J5BFG2_9BURK|nr:hypothetical protein LMG26845_05391 [Achromobacter insuavis]
MRAVDHAQLERLERRGLGGEARPAGGPVRPVGGEVVFHHPLQERLGLHRPGVRHAQRLRHGGAVLVGGARHDAVHHRAREGAGLADPFGQPRVHLRGERQHQAAQQMAVTGQVVQRQQRHRPQARRAAALQPPDQESDGAARRQRLPQVVHDVGMRQVQRAAGRIVAIAFLGHGQADDARVRTGDARQHRLRILRRHQRFQQAADHGQPRLRPALGVGAAQRQRVQPVLRRQRVAGIGLPQRHAANAPARIAAGMNGRFVHRRQVAARERAQPQVHDAGAQGAAVIGRPRHVRRQRLQARRMQPDGRGGYQFHNVPSCCSRFTGR